MPLISIIVPVYNGASTIQATVNSVVQQSFSDFELIIVDDGSSDNTQNILSRYTDPRIQVD